MLISSIKKSNSRCDLDKKFTIFLVATLILINISVPFAVSAEKEVDFSTIKENIPISSPIIKYSLDNNSVRLVLKEGMSMILSPERPMIPMITRVYTFPLGTEISNVKIDIENEKIILDKKIQPSSYPIPKYPFSENDPQDLCSDASVYDSTDLYPSKPYTIRKSAGLEDGNHVLFLKISCYAQYSPKSDLLYVPTNIEIKIEYKHCDTQLFAADEYDLLIITDEKFASKLQPLVNHKNSIGVRTILKTTQEIYPEYNGRDDAEDVKLCIKDAAEKWNVKYVLLAGGRKGQFFDWYVPVRVSNNKVYYGEEDRGYVTDLYFADFYKVVENETVFEDWDSNGNGIFAENSKWRQDVIDYHPDVYIGRAPFRYSFEVDIFVDKVIGYENNVEDSWFKKAAVVGGDSFPPSSCAGQYDHVYEGEVVTNLTANLLEQIGFEVNRLWLSLDAWSNPEDIVNVIDGGVGFVHFSGHGNPAGWATHYPDDFSNKFIEGLRIKDIMKLSNKNKLPIIMVGGCHNARFDVTLMNFFKGLNDYGIMGMFFQYPQYFFYLEWIPRDFCSWLVFKMQGGAIATIGNTGLGYSKLGENGDLDNDNETEPDCVEAFGGWIGTRFFDAYARQDKHILGEAHTQAIIDYINIVGNSYDTDIVGDINNDSVGRKTIEQWALIGDPSLKIGGI